MRAVMSSAQGRRETHDLLDVLLREVLHNLYPSVEDYNRRLLTISSLKGVIQGIENFKGASLVPFGSFESNLFNKWGDLDISIEIPSVHCPSELAKKQKKKFLNILAREIRRRGIGQSVELIPRARVPLLIFEDPVSNISCDISINNGNALLKSKYIGLLTHIDTRFRELVFLIKYWAKAHDINNPKSGTLNSFSLTLLVIFHLQTQSPRILPPLKNIYDGNIAKELKDAINRDNMAETILGICESKIRQLGESFGNRNQSSLSELLVSFFKQYAKDEKTWSTSSICTFTGNWENSLFSRSYPMAIEDPVDHGQNCARSVAKSQLKRISDAFRETSKCLQGVSNSTDMHSLRQILFGSSMGKGYKVKNPVMAMKMGGQSSETFMAHPVTNNQALQTAQNHEGLAPNARQISQGHFVPGPLQPFAQPNQRSQGTSGPDFSFTPSPSRLSHEKSFGEFADRFADSRSSSGVKHVDSSSWRMDFHVPSMSNNQSGSTSRPEKSNYPPQPNNINPQRGPSMPPKQSWIQRTTGPVNPQQSGPIQAGAFPRQQHAHSKKVIWRQK